VVQLQKINPDWINEPCIVVASGPSLTKKVAHTIRMARIVDHFRLIVVNDVYKMLPYAEILYAADNSWWRVHKDCPGFFGEKWACHNDDKTPGEANDKRGLAEEYGINLIEGADGRRFSSDPSRVVFGSNSGFQALNIALLKGCKRIILAGFDMRHVDGKSHFFGDHPEELATVPDNAYRNFANRFADAAEYLPKDVQIINATPGSALTCFPMMELEKAIAYVRRDCSGYRNRSEPHDGASAERSPLPDAGSQSHLSVHS
jgi:hypothetical protein